MKKIFKKIIASIAIIAAIPLAAFATPFIPYQGGTGTNTTPTLGQVLVGQSNGNYGPQATSTLGLQPIITGGSNGALTYWSGTGSLAATTSPTVGYITATSSATSTLPYLSVQGAINLLGNYITNLASYVHGLFSGSSPITYNASTGAIGCQTASGSQAGCLSSSDWTAFNAKQNALTLPLSISNGGTGTSTAPGANKLYIGGASGELEYIATSSLGISSSGGGVGTSTNPFMATYFVATGTATSTLPSLSITSSINLLGNYITNMATYVHGLFSGLSPISYNTSTGAISLGIVPISLGGTGTSTAPGNNKLYIGGPSGELEYVATSSLGISGGGGPSVPISLANGGYGITNTQTNISTNGTINNQAVASVYLNFNGNSNPTDLNGLVAQATGTEVVITNNTSSGLPFTIHHQNSGSTITNRFDLPKSFDIVVPFKASDEFRYNGSRWNYVGGFLTNFPVGSNGQVQLANVAGSAVDVASGFNWDYNNNRLAIPSVAISGSAQFVGNPQFDSQTSDGQIFFPGASGSDHGYLTSDFNLFWDNVGKQLGLGTQSPAARLHSVGVYSTIGDPTSFTASLVAENLTAVTPTDTPSLVYQPVAPTTSGLGYDATQNVGVGGFTANGQTISGTVYEGRIIGGTLYTDPVGFPVSFTDSINDGTTAFSLDWVWQPQANSDGSTPDFIIFADNTTGFTYYLSSGSASTFNDSANDPGSVPNTTPFVGFTSSGQLFSFQIGGSATSPTGSAYYSTPGSYSIADTLTNGSLFQIQHVITGASGGWRISQGLNQSNDGASNLTFYQSATFSNGGDLSTQHYGILSDGSALNRTFTVNTRNTSPLEYFSTGALTASTVDPNDSNYYSITYTFIVPAGGQGIRATENINGGTYTYRDYSAGASPFYQDALGGHFMGNSPFFTPTFRSNVAILAENTSDDTTFVPQLRLKTTNPNASEGFEMWEQNTLKASQKHLQSGDYQFLNSNGVYDFITLNGNGPTLKFLDSGAGFHAGIGGDGAISARRSSQITNAGLAVGSGDSTHSQLVLDQTTTFPTSPIAGGIEYGSTTSFFGSDSGIRRMFLRTVGSSPLAAGYLPLATSSGFLINSLIFNTATNVGIGTTTPTALLSLVGNSGVASSSVFSVSSSTSSLLFRVDGAGHLTTGGGTPTLTSCGTSPSIVGNDTAGQITFGGGALLTSCTVTFAVPMNVSSNNKVHVLVNQDSGSLGIFAAQSITTTGFVISTALSGATGDAISYHVILSN